MVPIPSKNVQVSLRAELASLLDPSGGAVTARVEEAVVLELFQQGVISSGKSSELLGITKDQFRHMLAKRQLPYFRQSSEEVLHDRHVAAQIDPD